jgi:diaminopimelate decarboxylase
MMQIKRAQRKIKDIVGSYVFSKKRSRLLDERRETDPIHPSTWGLQVSDTGHLMMGDCDVTQLADTYGTPLFVIDENQVRKNCGEVLNSFGSVFPNLEVFYSYKTNPVPEMLHMFHKQGIGAEVVSDYELWLALQLGVSPERIVVNGPNKSIQGLTRALENGVRLTNIDSFNEIGKIADISESMNRETAVGIRVVTGYGWSGKFGFSVGTGEAFDAARRIIRFRKLKLVGLHFHLGTGIESPGLYCSALDIAFKLVSDLKKRLGVEVEYLDIGGGFGIPTDKAIPRRERDLSKGFHIPPAPPELAAHPSPIDFAEPISEKIGDLCNYYGIAYPTVFVEPGRLLSSSAQILVLKVGDLKAREGAPQMAFVDGGTNIASQLMQKYHEAFVTNRMNEKERELYKIVGPLCYPGDVLYEAKFFPRMQLGDYLAIMDAGAYFVPTCNNFSFPRPAIVTVSEHGHRLARDRECFDDLVSHDRILLQDQSA